MGKGEGKNSRCWKHKGKEEIFLMIRKRKRQRKTKREWERYGIREFFETLLETSLIVGSFRN